MAFRRSGSFKRRSGSSRFRGSRLQMPHRPRKWERGNFYLPVEHDMNQSNVLTVLPIAQMTNIADNDTTTAGRSLTQAARYLEIGGIVYNAFFGLDFESGFTPPAQGDNGGILCRLMLCSDRVDDSTPPAPVALSTNWFTNTQPITGLGEYQDEQAHFPTQIHHQHARLIDCASYTMLDVSGDAPRSVLTENIRATGNVRLRLRLSDEQILCWHVATHIEESEIELGLACRITIVGTIFYRFVFGSR